MDEMRICVHVERPTMLPATVDRVNMSVWDTINTLRNIVHFLRNQYNGIAQKRARVEDIQVWTNEPTDDPRVCIVWNPETRQIRISVIGMDEWHAEIACDIAADLLMDEFMSPPKEENKGWLSRLQQTIRPATKTTQVS